MMAGGVSDVSEGGKAERFKSLALPYLDDVYTLARYLMRSASDADDAVQECYLRAFRHFDTFRGGPIKPWLMAILRNVCHAAYVGKTRLVFTAEDRCARTPEPVWHDRHRYAGAGNAAPTRFADHAPADRRTAGGFP